MLLLEDAGTKISVLRINLKPETLPHTPTFLLRSLPDQFSNHLPMAEQPNRPKWRPPRSAYSHHLEERCRASKRKPFLDEQPMVGDPNCSWANFCQPKLRACQLPRGIRWVAQLGYGLDGIVWKVNIDGRTYALKVVSLRNLSAGRCT